MEQDYLWIIYVGLNPKRAHPTRKRGGVHES